MPDESHALTVDTPKEPHVPVVTITGGEAVVTSVQVAEHFGKLHHHVLRTIRNLDCDANFIATNFGCIDYVDARGRSQQMYRITRDGFTILAMGFTGKAAMRWKLAYIRAFNLMESKLRELYVAPLIDDKVFRASIKLKDKLTLQAQSRATVQALEAESSPRARRNLYWQLRQINDTLGIPTESMRAWLGDDAIAIPTEPEHQNGSPSAMLAMTMDLPRGE